MEESANLVYFVREFPHFNFGGVFIHGKKAV